MGQNHSHFVICLDLCHRPINLNLVKIIRIKPYFIFLALTFFIYLFDGDGVVHVHYIDDHQPKRQESDSRCHREVKGHGYLGVIQRGYLIHLSQILFRQDNVRLESPLPSTHRKHCDVFITGDSKRLFGKHKLGFFNLLCQIQSPNDSFGEASVGGNPAVGHIGDLDRSVWVKGSDFELVIGLSIINSNILRECSDETRPPIVQ